jgi:hypothetical protein
MLSAPASIPATTLVVFTTAFGAATVTCSATRSYSPADSASRNTGTRPAADTRFGSSKTALTL